MRRCMAALCLAWLLTWLALPAHAAGPGSRKKPGPTTTRGVAIHVSSAGFTLQTTRYGSFTVEISRATSVVEKGKSGRLTVHEGDHVGVRGFMSGRSIRAIDIRIYPTAPKPYSITGKILAVHGSSATILSGGRTVTVSISGSTSIVVNRASGSIRDLRPGDRVDVRVEKGSKGVVALHIHVYQSTAHQPKVQLHGTVAQANGSSLTVRAGSKRIVVHLSRQTLVYLGAQRASPSAIHSGATVTVYACCAGSTLTASSVHVRKVVTATRTVLMRGQVIALSPTSLTLRLGSSVRRIALASSTAYELGAQHVGRGSLQLGDDVSVRAIPEGSGYRAVRVHVYLASRRLHTVVGVVRSVGRGQLTVASRGRAYVVQTGSSRVTLNNRRASTSALHPGDHVRIVGKEPNSGTVLASSIVATRAAPRLQTVHGVIVQANAGELVVSDGAGRRYRVRLAPGARPELQGKPAPAAALFPGARVTVRGRVESGVLVANRLTLQVTTRIVRGRVGALEHAWLTVVTSTGKSTRVDLPASVPVSDAGGRRLLSAIRVGTWLEVDGYGESGQAVRAASLLIEHPVLDFSAVVVTAGKTMKVQTTAGDRYLVRVSSGLTQISTGSAGIKLAPRDIPAGTRVHVRGRGATDGSVTATSLVVHLSSQTVEGAVTAVGEDSLTVSGVSGTVTVRLSSATAIDQGSHPLALAGVVVGDQVTVYGYALAGGVAARKVLVHRRLVGVDGTVASQTVDGFMLDAADGPHRVLVSGSTVFTGMPTSGPTPGLAVHVTGYLRGDGSILATRVRAGKK